MGGDVESGRVGGGGGLCGWRCSRVPTESEDGGGGGRGLAEGERSTVTASWDGGGSACIRVVSVTSMGTAEAGDGRDGGSTNGDFTRFGNDEDGEVDDDGEDDDEDAGAGGGGCTAETKETSGKTGSSNDECSSKSGSVEEKNAGGTALVKVGVTGNHDVADTSPRTNEGEEEEEEKTVLEEVVGGRVCGRDDVKDEDATSFSHQRVPHDRVVPA